MGPGEWLKISTKLMGENLMLGQAFKSAAQLLLKLEDSVKDWHLAPIWGHSCVHKLFLFYPTDVAILQVTQINTVSQIFDLHLSGGINKISL
jgi:hypothetical protein